MLIKMSGCTMKIPMNARPITTPIIAIHALLNAVTINATKRTMNNAHLISCENHVNNPSKLIQFTSLKNKKIQTQLSAPTYCLFTFCIVFIHLNAFSIVILILIIFLDFHTFFNFCFCFFLVL